MNWTRGLFRFWIVFAALWWAVFAWGVFSSRPLPVPPDGFYLDKPFAVFDIEMTARVFWIIALLPLTLGLGMAAIRWIAHGFRVQP